MEIEIKHLSIGAAAAFVWAGFFVIVGAIWSTAQAETLGLADHLHNGLVIAKIASLIGLLSGMPMFVWALLEISKNYVKNLRIGGFVVANIVFIVLLWSFGPSKFRSDPAPKTAIERVLDFKESLEREN